MNKIAFIADLHGNRAAVDALEKDLTLQSPEKVYCLGDIVGKGPSSLYTYEWARANCDYIIGGNWDYGIGQKKFPNDTYYWDLLGEERLSCLANLPREFCLRISGRKIRVFHGRPIMEGELLHCAAERELIVPLFTDAKGNQYDTVLYADTHRPGMRSTENCLFINTGSVGNAVGVPLCQYLIMEGEDVTLPADSDQSALMPLSPPDALMPLNLTFRSIPYDKQAAVWEITEAPSGYPRPELFRQEILTGIYAPRFPAQKPKVI